MTIKQLEKAKSMAYTIAQLRANIGITENVMQSIVQTSDKVVQKISIGNSDCGWVQEIDHTTAFKFIKNVVLKEQEKELKDLEKEFEEL